MKTILITGANGFLGSHLIRNMINDYKIICFEHPKSNLSRIKNFDIKVYTSFEDLNRFFEENKVWSIIHTATIYKNNNHSMGDLLSTNVLLPVKLFELANHHNCSLFLNTDTFFNNPKYNYSYLPEYTLSKKHAIDWLRIMVHKCKLINVKIHHMYGPDDSNDKFVPKILAALKSNVSSLDLTLGDQKRDFVFINDVVSAYRCILNNEKKLTNSLSELEVGTGIATSLKTFVETAKKATKSQTFLNFGVLPYRKGEIMESKAENSFLLNLDWAYKYDVAMGLQEMCQS